MKVGDGLSDLKGRVVFIYSCPGVAAIFTVHRVKAVLNACMKITRLLSQQEYVEDSSVWFYELNPLSKKELR